jgi:aminoglycoside phosphotransferase (APT) family kinase protein
MNGTGTDSAELNTADLNTATTVWEFDTAAWYQRLMHTGSSFALTRRYRQQCEAEHQRGQTMPPPVGRAAFVCGVRVDDSEFRFDLAVGDQLANQLWPVVSPTFLTDNGLQSMADLGRLVARLHGGGPPPPGDVGGPHVRRLRSYLSATDSPMDVSAVHAALQGETLGALRSIARTITDGPHLTCHGGFSLGSVFTDDDHKTVQVAIGPEMCCGPPELDLGWMIGELTEFEYTAANSGKSLGAAHSAPFGRAAQALLDGYSAESGREVDRRRLDDVVAARIALHMFDFVRTTGRTDHLAGLAPFVTWLTRRQHMRDNTEPDDGTRS